MLAELRLKKERVHEEAKYVSFSLSLLSSLLPHSTSSLHASLYFCDQAEGKEVLEKTITFLGEDVRHEIFLEKCFHHGRIDMEHVLLTPVHLLH